VWALATVGLLWATAGKPGRVEHATARTPNILHYIRHDNMFLYQPPTSWLLAACVSLSTSFSNGSISFQPVSTFTRTLPRATQSYTFSFVVFIYLNFFLTVTLKLNLERRQKKKTSLLLFVVSYEKIFLYYYYYYSSNIGG
jgi:hypothetical protein